jgi:flavin-dependent dehydrogenase
MRSVEVIVVGGGPAGSAAAQRLKAAGADVLVLDKECFPRHKLCAGWITPQVVSDLQLEISAYPHSFLSFRRLQWHLRGLKLPAQLSQFQAAAMAFAGSEAARAVRAALDPALRIRRLAARALRR